MEERHHSMAPLCVKLPPCRCSHMVAGELNPGPPTHTIQHTPPLSQLLTLCCDDRMTNEGTDVQSHDTLVLETDPGTLGVLSL